MPVRRPKMYVAGFERRIREHCRRKRWAARNRREKTADRNPLFMKMNSAFDLEDVARPRPTRSERVVRSSTAAPITRVIALDSPAFSVSPSLRPCPQNRQTPPFGRSAKEIPGRAHLRSVSNEKR